MTSIIATLATLSLLRGEKRMREKLTNGGWQGWQTKLASKPWTTQVSRGRYPVPRKPAGGYPR